MINNNANLQKLNGFNEFIHQIPAGIHPNDSGIEFWKDRKTNKVFYNTKGSVKPFKALPQPILLALNAKYQEDTMALADLSSRHLLLIDQLEAYAGCLFGASDGTADFKDGVFSESENFKCQPGTLCRCLKWKSKNFSINGNKLTYREIQILELIGKGYTDKVIASELNITLSTLDTHKLNLNTKAGVQSKTQLIIKASQQNAIQ